MTLADSVNVASERLALLVRRDPDVAAAALRGRALGLSRWKAAHAVGMHIGRYDVALQRARLWCGLANLNQLDAVAAYLEEGARVHS